MLTVFCALVYHCTKVSAHIAHSVSICNRSVAAASKTVKACFDLTDWTVFEAAATDLDELIDTVTSYISFCEDMCIPTKTHLNYDNDKPWFTAKLRQLHQAKEDAYRKVDKVLYKQAKTH